MPNCPSYPLDVPPMPARGPGHGAEDDVGMPHASAQPYAATASHTSQAHPATRYHILHVCPSFEVGGAQRRFANLLNTGSGLFRHTLIALDGNLEALSLIQPDNRPTIYNAPPKQASVIKSIMTARRILRNIAPDLVVTYNWGSIEWTMAANLSGWACVHTQDGFGEVETNGEVTRRRLARRLTYPFCEAVAVPSHTLEAQALAAWRISPRKLAYIANGIQLGRFLGSLARKAPLIKGLRPSDLIIGTVSALRPEKNLGRLIDAFSLIADEIRNTHLVIAGDGPARAALEERARRTQLKERIHFLGHISNPEEILPSFDVFALSSDTEQMPISVIEAMAAGKAIASTDTGDVKSMVASHNAPLVEGMSTEQLAYNLRMLLMSENLRERLGHDNAQKAQRCYSSLAMVTAYETLWSKAIQRRR